MWAFFFFHITPERGAFFITHSNHAKIPELFAVNFRQWVYDTHYLLLIIMREM
jgi:hypothetical protein